MLEVLLDSEGRLIEFHALPQAEHSGAARSQSSTGVVCSSLPGSIQAVLPVSSR